MVGCLFWLQVDLQCWFGHRTDHLGALKKVELVCIKLCHLVSILQDFQRIILPRHFGILLTGQTSESILAEYNCILLFQTVFGG